MEEKILCSAIWFDDKEKHVHQPLNIKTGFVISGRRHHNCFAVAAILDPNLNYKNFEQVQGFITDKDRFVDRYEAYIIAVKANQIENNYITNTKLYSEDLY